MSIKQERAAFEDWCGSQSLAVSRLDGEYIHDDTWTSWEAWRARAKAIELDRQGRGEPVAWVRNLTDPQPHCVTDLRYRTAADADAGVAYVPVFAHPQPANPAIKESLTVAEPVKVVSVPDGFRLIAVNAGFDALMFWMDRCEAKGHLENCPDLVEPWDEFEYQELPTPPADGQEKQP